LFFIILFLFLCFDYTTKAFGLKEVKEDGKMKELKNKQE